MLTRPQTRGGSGAIQPKAQNALTLAPVRAAQINGCDAVGARLIANPNCTTAIAVRTRVNPSKAVCAALFTPFTLRAGRPWLCGRFTAALAFGA